MSVVTSNQETDTQHMNMEEEDVAVKTCKICFLDEEDEDDKGPFVDVCPCKGSMKYVHHNCLVSWFQSSGQRKCPTCKTEVAVTEKFKPWRQWRWEAMSGEEFVWSMTFIMTIWSLCFDTMLMNAIFDITLLNSTLKFSVKPHVLQSSFLVVGITVYYLIRIPFYACLMRVLSVQTETSLGYLRKLLSANKQIALKPYPRK